MIASVDFLEYCDTFYDDWESGDFWFLSVPNFLNSIMKNIIGLLRLKIIWLFGCSQRFFKFEVSSVLC
jgi:hypothetical protein